ncbi:MULTISPECIES: hypothetical protein [unclassified Nocardiopsis]|uniref:hypothetical protein n=1 Tax=unclassified Nocardiopsis TaxID=2649073 RepID=UPI0033DD47D4
MFPSGQDPYDPDTGRGGVPSQRGLPDFDAPHLEALRPDAPMPRKVVTVRTLMFVGGVSGLLLLTLFLMGLSAPDAVMREALDEQAAIAAEQGVALSIDVEAMRSYMGLMALVTGVYGTLSVLIASRLRRRTVGVFWSALLFQGAAGGILLWSLLSGGLLAAVPLGFAAAMLAFLWSKESRAYFGLL